MMWIKELFNPAKKCARIGHVAGAEYREGYRRPGALDFRCVIVSVTQSRPACLRCKEPLEPLNGWRELSATGIQGYTWPKERVDAFRRDGAIWDRTWFGRGDQE